MTPARRLRVVLTAATGVALVLLGAGMPVGRAHDELVASSPAEGATVSNAPSRVELQLSAPAQALGTRVQVRGPDGAVVSQDSPRLRDATVAQPLGDDLPAGKYTVQWRVTSADGHPVSGTFTFTVAQGAGPAPDDAESMSAAGEQSAAGAREAATERSDESFATVGWIAAGALLLIAGGGMLARKVLRQS